MKKTKLILFGGTFDPIHLGHTAVAFCASQTLNAGKTILIPAKRSPLKALHPQAGDKDRLTMITLALADYPSITVSDYELKKNAPCYTIDTVAKFKADFPASEIYWLIGADALDELPLWYKIDELLDQCSLCVMYRAGFAPPDFEKFTAIWGASRIAKLRQNVIETPLINISSTAIRARLAAGLDASDMLAPKVAQYIKTHNLYKPE